MGGGPSSVCVRTGGPLWEVRLRVRWMSVGPLPCPAGKHKGGYMKAKASKPVTGVLTFVAAAIILLMLGIVVGGLSAIFG